MTRTVAQSSISNFSVSFAARVAFPVISILLVAAAALAAVVLTAADQSNSLSAARQQALARAALAAAADRVGYEQESTTVWSEALSHANQRPVDQRWFDDNLGIWMHDYYGHDEAYVLDARDEPLYAMRDGKRDNPQIYQTRLAALAAPLIAGLRAELGTGDRVDVRSPQRTPGLHAFLTVGGHPAIVSVKPITGDGGALRQGRSAALHLSVRRLDGNFAGQLGAALQLPGMRYSRVFPGGGASSALTVTDPSGRSLGYLVWPPFRPGALMLARIAPIAAAAFLLLLATLLWMLRRIRNMTDALAASRTHARHLAFHDPLTGLGNRNLANEKIAQAFAEFERHAAPLALLHIDVVRFQHIYDALGPAGADELIAAVAKRLTAITRESDCVARIGADEFLIVGTDAHTAASAEVMCLRIMEALAEPFHLLGSAFTLRVSIGVALAPLHANNRNELLRKADIALRSATSAGGGRYIFFDPAMDEGVQGRVAIEQDLRSALAWGGEFVLEYQPLVEARSRRLFGVEALLRWRHPQRGNIAPSLFIPIAEASGLIADLGDWVLRQACADAVRFNFPTVAVNISAVQLAEPAFAARCLGLVAEAGLEPQRLEVEVTETSLIENVEGCRTTLAALRAAGIKVALDDFGTGFSSLSHLRRFDIDRIKIDRSFVGGIDADEGGREIVAAMIGLARAGGLHVTAEGVETEAQVRFLRRSGCQLLQGFYISRPIPADAVAAFARGIHPSPSTLPAG